MTSSAPSVLLVDDHAQNLALLETVLEPLGVECVCARSGGEALREVLRRDFAAILMDVSMPDMSGIEAAEMIKRRPRCGDTPIVFITGHAHEPELITKAFSLGAIDYVVKPYDPALLRSKIAALIDLHVKDAALRVSEERFRTAFEHAPIGIAIIGLDGEWLDVNAALPELLGRTREVLLKEPPFDLHRMTAYDGVDELQELLQGGRRSFAVERRLLSATGATIWVAIHVSLVRDRYGDPLHLICQVEDVTERKQAEESLSKRIAYLAYHDELTGLPNRAMFREHLDLALARAARHNTAVAVLNLDLNRFKLVNDSLGHAAGDQLLREAGARLAGAVRASDLVARVGGDEFIVLLADLELGAERDIAELVANGIHESLTRPFIISGAEFYVGTSVGIALYPHDALGGAQPDAEGLLRKADAAMYQAKQRGMQSMVAREPEAAPIERLELMTRLRRATDEEAFVLHWLPIVDLDTGRICGAEALIRWPNGDGGWTMPGEFLALAEETGLIDRIGMWVLREAARQQAEWRADGLDLDVTINVSQRQLWKPHVAREMIDALEAAGGDPRRFVFELTESNGPRPSETPQRARAELRDAGIRIAIDDFAHSPLVSLQGMEVDMLKIDRGVIAGASAPGGELMMRAMIHLAHNFGIWAVATGIETFEQYGMLRKSGCRFGQGYYFCAPVPAEELSELSSTLTSCRPDPVHESSAAS